MQVKKKKSLVVSQRAALLGRQALAGEAAEMQSRKESGEGEKEGIYIQ